MSYAPQNLITALGGAIINPQGAVINPQGLTIALGGSTTAPCGLTTALRGLTTALRGFAVNPICHATARRCKMLLQFDKN